MLAIDRPGAEQKRVYPLAADLTVRGEAPAALRATATRSDHAAAIRLAGAISLSAMVSTLQAAQARSSNPARPDPVIEPQRPSPPPPRTPAPPPRGAACRACAADRAGPPGIPAGPDNCPGQHHHHRRNSYRRAQRVWHPGRTTRLPGQNVIFGRIHALTGTSFSCHAATRPCSRLVTKVILRRALSQHPRMTTDMPVATEPWAGRLLSWLCLQAERGSLRKSRSHVRSSQSRPPGRHASARPVRGRL